MYAAGVANMLAKGDFFLEEPGKEENLTRFGNFWDSFNLFLLKAQEEGQTTVGYEFMLKQINDISKSADKQDQIYFIKDVRNAVEKVEKMENGKMQSDLFDGLLEIVLRYSGSPNDNVRSLAISVLLELQTSSVFNQSNFIEVIKKVLDPASTPKCQQLEIMYTLAPIIGSNNTKEYLWPIFLRMTKELSHCSVRQALVRTLGMFCRILGSEWTGCRLWPIYMKLSKDNTWRVRQQCARILPIVSLFSSPLERDRRIAPLIKSFLRDESRYVFLVASDMLGIYLATFAKPRILTVFVNSKMELSLPNPADEDFKECLQKESEREKFASYEEMFTETLNRHSYKAPGADSNRQDRFHEIVYPLDVGGRILEKYFRLSNLPVKLHLAGSDEAHRRRELEDFFNKISFDTWINDFRNIISDKVHFEQGNISEFFPYQPPINSYNNEDDLMEMGSCERSYEKVLPIPLPAPPPPVKSLSAKVLEEEDDDDSDEESSPEMEELLRDLQEESPELWQKLADAHSERKQARKAAAAAAAALKAETPECNPDESSPAEPSAEVDEAEKPKVPEIPSTESAPVASIAPIVSTPLQQQSSQSSTSTSKDGKTVAARGPNTQCHLKRNTPHDLRDIISQAIEDSTKRKMKYKVSSTNKIFQNKDKSQLPPPPQTASIEDACKEPNYFPMPSTSEKRATFAEIVSRGVEIDDKADKNENILSDFNDNPSESCVVLDSNEESVVFRKNISEREQYSAVRKTLLVRSNALCLTTSSDSNENWCCDPKWEKNGNCKTQEVEDDDDAKEFNSHNFWYIAPESVTIDDISGNSEKSDSSDIPTTSPVLDDTSMASLPMHNLCESPDDSGYREMDFEKTRSQMTDGNIDPALLKQDVLPPELLQSFITKANSDETEVSIACAYSFPAVALTLGRQNWHLLHQTLQKLCANQKVCYVVINSFYHIALIIGRENATNHLLPLYLGFFDCVTRIRREALKIVHNFLSTVDETRHVDVIAKLPICLADFHKANETKYHVRENFMNVVLSLMHMYDRNDAPEDCVNYLTAYALAMLVDKVHRVRELALEALVVRVRTCRERDFANLLQAVTEECGESVHWRNRQTFVRLVHRWVEEDFIDMRVFVRDILPRLLVLSTDRVPNVRLVVGRCLFKTVVNHPHFSKVSMEEEKSRIQAVIERLESDTDMDVRESCGGIVRRFTSSESDQYCDDTKEFEDPEDESGRSQGAATKFTKEGESREVASEGLSSGYLKLISKNQEGQTEEEVGTQEKFQEEDLSQQEEYW